MVVFLCLSLRPAEAMEIRNISFVNARTKVVNCTVQNVSVDITVSQVSDESDGFCML